MLLPLIPAIRPVVPSMPISARRLSLSLLVALSALAACGRGETLAEGGALASSAAEPGPAAQDSGGVAIAEVMVDPTRARDERGEWFAVRNGGGAPVQLRGWTIRSGRDAPQRIARSLVVSPGGRAVLGRSADARANGGVTVDYVYTGIALANGADWLALTDPSGRTVDSVAWRGARPGVALVPPARAAAPRASGPARAAPSAPAGKPAQPATAKELTVRVLDVGQGDAILMRNGGSTVLVDGGPDSAVLGRQLDRLGLDGDTIDVVILTHQHLDHYAGLGALFESARHITVRFFFENRDPSPNVSLARLRDSVAARARRGTLAWRDTDDPCGDGRALCTITLRGGALLHVMRPMPGARDANDRSPALKLVGPDSASFTMWLAGDAEHDAIAWFERAGYARTPGMRVDVLKADHHGSCNGISARYLDLTRPSWVVASLGAVNDYGHMHAQTKQLLAGRGIPWYRTDQNGTITIRTPGTPHGGYTITPERGTKDMDGPSDKISGQVQCRS